MRAFSLRSRKFNIPVLYLCASFTLLFVSRTVVAQCFINPRMHKITANVSPTIKSYMEFKPADYETNPTRKYPLIVYEGGTGEMFQQPGGTDQDLCPIVQYSLPMRLNQGQFPNTVWDQNGTPYSYFVVMPFVTQWDQQYSVDPGPMIDYVLQHYPGRIDVSRIYLTGMSRGTDNIMSYATSSVANARRLAAVAPVANCFSFFIGTPQYEGAVQNLSNGNVHLWGFQCHGDRVCDEYVIQSVVHSMDSLKPSTAIFTYSTFACDTGTNGSYHYAWNQAYDPEFRPAESGNKNLAEWLIQFSQNISLPVTIKDWTARLDRGKVLLEWTTSQEFNTKQFLVQRAVPGADFRTVLTVPAAVTSNADKKYSEYDEHPLPGESLYRLVEEDNDGNQQVFPIKRVVVPGAWRENVIIPNPVEDGTVSIYVRVTTSQQLTVRLIDLTGRVISQQVHQTMPGETQYTVNVSLLQRGTYIVQLNSEEIRTVKKITIQ